MMDSPKKDIVLSVSKANRVPDLLFIGIFVVTVPLTLALHNAIPFLVFLGLGGLSNLIFHIRVKQPPTKEEREVKKNTRDLWLDELRGFIALCVLISAVLYFSSGQNLWSTDGSAPATLFTPVGPTWINHGTSLFHLEGWPEIITWGDLGSLGVVSLMGLTRTRSLYKRMESAGKGAAAIYAVRSFIILLSFSILFNGMIAENSLDLRTWNIPDVFYNSIFASLGWAILSALLLLILLPGKPDIRMFIAGILFLSHLITYEISALHVFRGEIGDIVWFTMPWYTLNALPVCILGTCYHDWTGGSSPDRELQGFKTRIIPLAVICIALSYTIGYLQPPNHWDSTTALALLSVSSNIFIYFLFRMFDRMDLRIPGLAILGRNLLVVYVLSAFGGYWAGFFDNSYLAAHQLYTLWMVGIVPIAITFSITWILDRLNIIIKI